MIKTGGEARKRLDEMYVTTHAAAAALQAESEEQCIVLGAGAPHTGATPALLRRPVGGVRVIEWILDALGASAGQASLVVGYQAGEIAERYPDLSLIQNVNWQATGSGMSLLAAQLDPRRAASVCYGDVLFRRDVVAALDRVKAPIAVAWDSAWRNRYAGRDNSDLQRCEKVVVAKTGAALRLGPDVPIDWASGEFIGLVRLSPEAVGRLAALQKQHPETRHPESLRRAHLSGLIEWLRSTGMAVGAVDVAGDWAEVNAPADIARFVLGTKAETLGRLRELVSSAVIQDQVSFSVAAWQADPSSIIGEIRTRFAGQRLVVRSSARSEDSFTSANAGAYTSLLDVDPDGELVGAIDKVIASYRTPQPGDQVLVQPMVTGVSLCGVAFTRTLERGAPYYVINYDETGATDSITDGSSRDHHTAYLYREASVDDVADRRLAPIIVALREIETLLGYDALDVEFALDEAGAVHILQVRPIAVPHDDSTAEANCHAALDSARRLWKRLEAGAPHLPGGKPMYGVMPDWNPAEIIGTCPGSLAQGLYRSLIMDEVWATQRAEYGYRDVRPHPLLVSFAGRPYVDVRASFSSFVPASVPDELAGKLVRFYLKRLADNPNWHDKIEFDVLPTCLSFGFERWRQRLLEADFSPHEIDRLRCGLQAVTVGGMQRLERDLATVANLASRFALFADKRHPALDRARWLLDDCRRLGTLPFAHLARGGFIAVTLLREAVAQKILSEAAHTSFFSTIRTVSHELVEDAQGVAAGKLSWGAFVKHYGHLRPGTYDIQSPCYAEDPEQYLRPLVEHADEAAASTPQPVAWENEKASFFAALAQLGLPADPGAVESFLRQAIEGREKAKFIFTRSLSAALEALAEYGAELGLTRDELAHVALDELLPPKDTSIDPAAHAARLRASAAAGLGSRAVARTLELPPLLTCERDFSSFVLHAGSPNFIGSTRVAGDCYELTGNIHAPPLEGKIVLIAHADPGYDWVFGQGVAGLVTMYGGANSHMAIRAAEFGLPAAIGVGEQRYRELQRAAAIELDPANATLRILR